MTKLRLDALAFSIDDYLAIRDWSQRNHHLVDVHMPSGIAWVSLTSEIYLPDLFHSGTDGVLIADHRRYSDRQIEMVVRQLRSRNKWLYSVTRGLEPVRSLNPALADEHPLLAHPDFALAR